MSGTLDGLRTVFWLYGFGIGGAERQAFAFAKYLRDEHGVIAEMWSFEESGPITALCDAAGIPWHAVPIWPARIHARQLAIASLRVARTLRKAGADVILPYMTPANILCCSSWRLSGAKTCVWNQRNAGIDEVHPGAERFAVRRPPALVANSEQGGNYLVDTLGASRDRVHVIRNAVLVDPPQCDRATWRARLGVDESAFVVTMVANLHRWKDHETLLHAWAIVCKEMNAQPLLALAGNPGETAEQMRALANELGITSRIAFLGLVDDVAGLLAASNAGVLLNRVEEGEGCPNAVIEAMAAGLPVVASDIGGSREVLGPDLKEWLAAPRDARQVADRLLALARNRELREETGARARRRVMQEFSIETTFGRYAMLLEQLVKRH